MRAFWLRFRLKSSTAQPDGCADGLARSTAEGQRNGKTPARTTGFIRNSWEGRCTANRLEGGLVEDTRAGTAYNADMPLTEPFRATVKRTRTSPLSRWRFAALG